MVAVDRVLEGHLPVAPVRVLEDAGAQHDLALRREVDELVDQAFGGAKMLIEAWAGRAQTRENQSAMRRGPRHFCEAELLLAERLDVATRIGHANQIAAIVVSPSVVGAAEGMRITAVALAHRVAAMHAAVEQQMNFAVLVSRYDHWLRADIPRYIVARLRHFTLMCDVYPFAMPDLFQFFLVNRRIIVDTSADAVVEHEPVVVNLRRIQHRGHVRHLLCCNPCRSRVSAREAVETPRVEKRQKFLMPDPYQCREFERVEENGFTVTYVPDFESRAIGIVVALDFNRCEFAGQDGHTALRIHRDDIRLYKEHHIRQWLIIIQ